MNSTILALKQFVIVALQPLEADTGTTLSMCREREREKKKSSLYKNIHNSGHVSASAA